MLKSDSRKGRPPKAHKDTVLTTKYDSCNKANHYIDPKNRHFSDTIGVT